MIGIPNFNSSPLQRNRCLAQADVKALLYNYRAVLLSVTSLFHLYTLVGNTYIWIFSISLLMESLRNLYHRIAHCITFTAKSYLAPTTKKGTDSNSRNRWHIQSKVLIRSLLGWASSCILLESLFLCSSQRYLGTGSHTNAWRKRQMSQTVGKFPGQQLRLLTHSSGFFLH